jgi:hypothetical protein
MMSEYNWCHNPKCHTKHTQDRIRGVKGKKVLRTRKIKVNRWNSHHTPFKYFCSQSCYDEFTCKYIDQIIAIAPVNQASETPIDVQVINHPQETTEYGWTRRAWTEKRITPIENNQ